MELTPTMNAIVNLNNSRIATVAIAGLAVPYPASSVALLFFWSASG